MKLKHMLPLGLAMTFQMALSQLSFGQSRFSKEEFQFKRDSIDNAIKRKIVDHEYDWNDSTKLIQPAEFKSESDTAHYRLLTTDSTSRMQPNAFNLSKEVAAHRNTKKGFVYQSLDGPQLLSMKNAEELLATTALMTKQYGIDSVAVYMTLDNNELMALIAEPAYFNENLEKIDSTTVYGIHYTSRFLQGIHQETSDFVIYHEGGHVKHPNTHTPKELSILPEEEQNYLGHIIEYTADLDAEEILGEEKMLVGIGKFASVYKSYQFDNAITRLVLQQNDARQSNFSDQSEDHPTMADRQYAVILKNEYVKNKELAEIYESLMPEPLKIALKTKNIIK